MQELVKWAVCAACFFIPWYLIRRYGLMAGGRAAWVAVLLLAPCWMRFYSIIYINDRALCAMVLLVGWMFMPAEGDEPRGWQLADLLLLLLITAMTISQIAVRSDAPLAPFQPLREMALPYLVGRMFVRAPRDIETILPVFSKCLVLLAGYALLEALWGRNPMEIVLGRPWSTGGAMGLGGEDLDAYRWGLKRAYGPQTHSIYLGLTFAMTLPWAVEAAVQSFNGKGPGWWKLVPLFALGGVVATGSRAAQLCSLMVLASISCQSAPRLRPLLVIAVVLGGVGYLTFHKEVVTWLQDYAGESKEGASYVKINGIEHEYSGTKHRDLLFIVYEEAIENAGWLGYGTLMLKMPSDPDMDNRFRSIDNHYLNFYLQYGYLGLTLFCLFTAVVLLGLLPAYFGTVGPPGRLIGGMLGAIAGCLIAMRGVWFAPDFGDVWLFGIGLSVSLAGWYRQARAAVAQQLA